MKTNRESRIDIAIRADGSKEIGLGHISPMVTLAKELSGRGYRVSFISYDDPGVMTILKRENIAVETISHPRSFDQIAKSVENLSPRLVVNNTWQNESSDHFSALKAKASRLVGFHQVDRGIDECNVVINPLPSAFLHLLRPPKENYCFGPNFLILPAEVTVKRRQNRTRAGLRQAVVALGGTDTWGLSDRIKNDLADLLPHTKIAVPAGKLPQVRFCELLRESDLAVIGGGNLVFETAYLGIPSLAVATESWETETIDYARKRHSLYDLGFRLEVDKETLTHAVNRLTLRKRQQMSLAGKKMVDGKGLSRVIAIIESQLK